jgi:hypothetical protein
MMSVVSISKITRMIGWGIFLLLVVNFFDLSLLSKHSVPYDRSSIQSTALR